MRQVGNEQAVYLPTTTWQIIKEIGKFNNYKGQTSQYGPHYPPKSQIIALRPKHQPRKFPERSRRNDQEEEEESRGSAEYTSEHDDDKKNGGNDALAHEVKVEENV